MASVVVNIPDSVDLSKVNDIKLCIRYCKDNDEYSYVTDGFSIQEERPQGDLISRSEAEKLGATCLARRNENGQLEAIISLEAICEEMTTDGHCNCWKLCPNKEEKPQVDCENCDFRKFSEKFVDGVVELMNENGITSLEQLTEILKGGAE